MNPPAELTFDAVGKTFSGTVALAEFTLTVRAGEFVTLLGPSGCGKTTALRIAAGFERPTSGRLLMGGLDITNQAPNARNMGMVFQNYSLFPHLTVADNVGFGPRMRRLARAETRQIARDMLDLVQLGDLAARYPHQLSGGQQQRVALARALAMKPSVLLLDEPLSALDAKVRTEVRDEIRSLTTRLGTTTLFVTHDQEEALGVSDRICVMNAGSVEQVGSPTEVYDRPTTEFVAAFVGELNVVRLGGADVRVRPEQIHFVDTDNADCRGRIEDVSFRGSYVRYIVRLDDGQSVTVSQPHAPHVTLVREETVGLRIGTDFGKVLSN